MLRRRLRFESEDLGWYLKLLKESQQMCVCVWGGAQYKETCVPASQEYLKGPEPTDDNSHHPKFTTLYPLFLAFSFVFYLPPPPLKENPTLDIIAF